jgi:uncharacterized peroxidase-related enzyme
MPQLLSNNLPMIEEREAEGEIAVLYDEIRRGMQLTFIPNIMMALATSPTALRIFWDVLRHAENFTLPQSLIAMISFTIATKSECEYCSANNELTCRTLGVDEDTLTRLIDDLDNVRPERVRAIIEFALMVAKHPKELKAEDYERVRQRGVTDEEIIEIIVVAAFSVFGDTLADALKIEVEPVIKEALGRQVG